MPNVKILVIDDERSFHTQISRILQIAGYETECVETGENALTKLRETKYDVILLDIVLKKGRFSGIETLNQIRQLKISNYIIITSAYADTEQAVRIILEKGAHTYLRKPFTHENLLQTVKSGLKWKNPYANIYDEDLKYKIRRQQESQIKRCFLTGEPYCPREIKQDDHTIFVGMPFTDSADHIFSDLYDSVIKPAIQEAGFYPWRADEQLSDIIIMCKICQGIQEAKYAIIDITTWNSNVLFELGLAFGLGRPTLLLKNQDTPLFTDLKGFEYIEYRDDFKEIKNQIVKHIHKLTSRDFPQ